MNSVLTETATAATSRGLPAAQRHPASSHAEMPLLEMRDVSIEFETAAGTVEAVRNFNLTLMPGRKLAIVGESGSGKSTVAATINGLLAENGRVSRGEIRFAGQNIVGMRDEGLRKLRGAQIGLVPQDPMTNLNPLQRVGTQIGEIFDVHGNIPGGDKAAAVVELLRMVGIPEPERRARQFPHELSGGMRQRVLIAIGLACRPRLLIADEPTSALDVTVQRLILDQLGLLTDQLGTALILITHDLPLAAERADDIIVMNKGEVVESGSIAEVMRSPKHPYTQKLLAAAPMIDSRRLVGAPPEPRIKVGEIPEPALLELVKVRKVYDLGGFGFGQRKSFVAVDSSSFTVQRGETVAIVGESGSGKTTTAKLLLRIEKPTSGDILFAGKEVTNLRGDELMAFRRRIQPVFQNPYGSLDGRFTVRQTIEEPLLLHRIGTPAERRDRVDELLHQVALPPEMALRRPSEISGGQSQRVAIARALALNPELVILDEAVSALDVVIQAQILELLARLQQELGLSYLFISHNLAVVRLLAHRVQVMKAGEIVESGATEELFDNPGHPYTRQLLAAIPRGETHRVSASGGLR